MGSGAANGIVLPPSAPESLGWLVREGEEVTFRAAPGVEARVDGEPATEIRLADDRGGAATQVSVGPLTFWVIHRAGRQALRLRDPGSHVLASYRGTDRYPDARRWIVDAVYTPTEARPVQVPNILGSSFADEVTGSLSFELEGRTLELLVTGAGRSVVFGDRTNGQETYGGGRALPLPAPDEDGRVRLDFNRAYNLPCAYSPYTTCPTPLPENRLPMRIEAGEMAYGDVHGP